jgi:hypothetical protein
VLTAESANFCWLGQGAGRDHGAVSTGKNNMLRTILIVVLILALVGALPAWPYSTGWGYYPSSGLGLVLLVLVVLAVTGRL